MQHLNECKVLSWEPSDGATPRGGPVWGVAPRFPTGEAEAQSSEGVSQGCTARAGVLAGQFTLLPLSVLPCVLWLIKASFSVTPEGRRQHFGS